VLGWSWWLWEWLWDGLRQYKLKVEQKDVQSACLSQDKMHSFIAVLVALTTATNAPAT